MPPSEFGLRSRGDFQRFCADLRNGPHELDDLVEALRALHVSELRPLDKTRFARSIARYLSETFHAAEVRAVASVGWPAEIAMAIRKYAPVTDVPTRGAVAGDGATTTAPVEPTPVLLPHDLGPATVMLLGDEGEHRPLLERLRSLGLDCLRVGTLPELHDAFSGDVVAGIVVGSSFWSLDDPRGASPRRRLEQVLGLSNIAWIKLVRSPAWDDARERLPEICAGLYLSPPPMTRLAVESQAALTNLELGRLADAIADLNYAERRVHYEFQPSVAQDRILRAVTSRYLRQKFPTVHSQESPLRVRSLANRGTHGLVALVSLETDVSFVVKVSPYPDALQEARRFRMVAHGTSFEMEFFCHATLGALVFAPIDARLGHARSLDDLLSAHDLLTPLAPEPVVPHAASIDAAIAALCRFSQQVRTDEITTFSDIEFSGTQAMVRRGGPLVVADAQVDIWWLYNEGAQILARCGSQAMVHGDAHPGNILFSTTGSAILVDFECAGLGPACTDLCTLWMFALASRFIAVGSERETIDLFRDLLSGMPFEEIASSRREQLRFSVNVEVIYLASAAIESSVAAMAEHGGERTDVIGIVAVLACRELFNPTLQQLVLRCVLAATWELRHPA